MYTQRFTESPTSPAGANLWYIIKYQHCNIMVLNFCWGVYTACIYHRHFMKSVWVFLFIKICNCPIMVTDIHVRLWSGEYSDEKLWTQTGPNSIIKLWTVFSAYLSTNHTVFWILNLELWTGFWMFEDKTGGLFHVQLWYHQIVKHFWANSDVPLIDSSMIINKV